MKIKLFICSFVLIWGVSFCNATDTKIYYEYEKSGGKFIFNWFKSYIGFDTVSQSEYNRDGHKVKRVTCSGAGAERCKAHVGHVNYTNISVSEKNSVPENFIYSINSSIIDEIEYKIVNDRQYIGRLSKQVQTISLEGNICNLVFDAKWTNLETEGTGRILITIKEIERL